MHVLVAVLSEAHDEACDAALQQIIRHTSQNTQTNVTELCHADDTLLRQHAAKVAPYQGLQPESAQSMQPSTRPHFVLQCQSGEALRGM